MLRKLKPEKPLDADIIDSSAESGEVVLKDVLLDEGEDGSKAVRSLRRDCLGWSDGRPSEGIVI